MTTYRISSSRRSTSRTRPWDTAPAIAREPIRYDPWRDLADNWPDVELVVEPMAGDLLGQVRRGGALIALRAGTSSAQSRCTLAHEIVHLERGLMNCGPWQLREENAVHAEVARRLIPVELLADAICYLGGDDSPRCLAQLLDVDLDTLRTRQRQLDRFDRDVVSRAMAGQTGMWATA